MTVEIRLAREDELEAVQRLNSGAFENDKPHDPYLVMNWPFDPATGGGYFKQRIAGDGGVCLVAVAEDQSIVGYVCGGMHQIESYRSGMRSELENMFVDENFRRSGVGTALIEHFVEWSRQQGADEVYVSAYFDNQRAISFYKSAGFESYSHDLLLDLRTKS